MWIFSIDILYYESQEEIKKWCINIILSYYFLLLYKYIKTYVQYIYLYTIPVQRIYILKVNIWISIRDDKIQYFNFQINIYYDVTTRVNRTKIDWIRKTFGSQLVTRGTSHGLYCWSKVSLQFCKKDYGLLAWHLSVSYSLYKMCKYAGTLISKWKKHVWSRTYLISFRIKIY